MPDRSVELQPDGSATVCLQRLEIAEQVASKWSVGQTVDDSLVFHVVGMHLVAFALDALDSGELVPMLLVSGAVLFPACLRGDAAAGSSAGLCADALEYGDFSGKRDGHHNNT